MSSGENHASSSVSQCTYQDVTVAHAPQTTKIKNEPIETRMTLGPSGSFKLTPSELTRVKSESNELLAKVNYFFLDPRFVVNATFFQCLDPTAASGADDTNEEMKQSLQSVVPSGQVKSYIAPLFEEHKSAEEIAYSPEAAVKEGINMIQTLKVQMRNLKLGSKLREEVWAREISRSVIAVMADPIILKSM